MLVFQSRRRLAAVALIAALAVLAAVVGLVPVATADTAPIAPTNPATPPTVSADALPTVQIDGVAWSQVVVGNTVYVAGEFSTARPAEAAPGVNTTPRDNLLAYDIRTGELITSFAPSLNAQALVVRASPDGSRLYVGGDFTEANGEPRFRIAAYSTATGALIPEFRPVVTNQVRAIAATTSTVYIGGTFTSVGAGGADARSRLAAFDAVDGAVLPWAPTTGVGRNRDGSTAVNAQVNSLVLTDGGAKVVAAGHFGSLNGVAASGVGAVDAVTGGTLPFAANQLITNQGDDASITSLSADADTVYGTGYDFGGPGNLEGTFAADASTGALRWVQACRGDHYEAFSNGSAVYMTSHVHVCSNITNGWPETNPRSYHHAAAYSRAATGVVGTATFTNSNFAGKPAPNPLNWYPTFTTGSYTGQGQAGWSVVGNSDFVVYGGEFVGVNNRAQQGLVRFAIPSIAPNRVGPNANTGLTPTVASFVAGQARVSWQTTHDPDNEILTYKVFRNGDLTTPVYQTTAASTFYQRSTIGFLDTGLTPGQSYSYQVFAYDPFGNSATQGTTSVTVTGSGVAGGAYYYAVRGSGATNYWRLGELSGTTGYDSARYADLTVGSGVTRDTAGALVGNADPATTFNGSSTGFATTRTTVAAPNVFSIEAWFKTGSNQGGKIVGFGNRNTGNSTIYDRHINLDNSGRVVFGVVSGSSRTVQSNTGFNNNQWHHVVASMGPGGMQLYVDGVLVASRADTTSGQAYSGYWRIGGDTRIVGNSNYLNGAIDDVSVYPSVLSAADVTNHRDRGRGILAANVPPSAAFTSSVNQLNASFNAAVSSDSDGMIASYAWDFGDGSTGSGVWPTHTFAATGTYSVTLTVTDDRSGTGTVTHPITVTAPDPSAPLAQDAFARTLSGSLGTADVGGLWSVVGTLANYSVTDDAARFAHSTANTTRSGYLNSVSVRDLASQVAFSVDKLPTGGGTYASVLLRHVGTTDYRAKVRIYASGAVQIQLTRVVSGSETVMTTVIVPGLTYLLGDVLQIRFEANGANPTTLRSKVWKSGSAEPAAWQITTTDATVGLQSAGGIGLLSFLSGSTTNAPTVASFDDLWAGAVGTGPPVSNSAPTAAFAAATDGLGARFDASGSSDADGSIVDYAWSFGDGATGGGIAPEHAYASAGTYSVTLTVTDDDAATGTASQPVEVTVVVAPIAQDGFERSVSGGLGTADVGGPWAVAGSPANYSVTGGAARVANAPGSTRTGYLNGVSVADLAIQVAVSLDQAPTGGGSYLSVVGRHVGSSDYRAKLRIYANGAVQLQVTRVISGAETVLGTALIPNLTYTAGEVLLVRFEIEGSGTTALRAKVWKPGSVEPAAWQLSASDSTAALQGAGGIGVASFLSGTATLVPVTSIDDLWAGPVGSRPPVLTD